MSILDINKIEHLNFIEKILDSRKKIKLSNNAGVVKNVKNKDLVETILNESTYYSSYYVHNDSKFCSQFDCRTISDIYRLSKYYNTTIKLYQVYDALIKLIEEGKCFSWICEDIGKRVYGISMGSASGLISEPIDEFHIILPEHIKNNEIWYVAEYTRKNLRITNRVKLYVQNENLKN